MTELKGVAAINMVLNKWLMENGFECTAELGAEFAYYHADSLIRYSFCFDSETEPWFHEVMDECGLRYNCDSFLLGFFHELGHNMTMDELSDDDYDYSYAEIARLEDEGADGREDHMIYFHLPLEIAATQWAVNFINENAECVKKLWDELQPRIKAFYVLNEVECE